MYQQRSQLAFLLVTDWQIDIQASQARAQIASKQNEFKLSYVAIEQENWAWREKEKEEEEEEFLCERGGLEVP